MGNSKTVNRVWELDFFRGLASICMVYFHVIFDLKELYNYPVSYGSGFNYYVGKVSVILFSLVAAISCNLSRNNIKRGIRILALGLLITVATHLYNPALGVKFGVLHFLGISILLYQLFKRLDKYILFLLGTIVIITGKIFARITVSHDYLFVFGITSSSFVSSDYYPLFPWYGLFLYGMALGKILYSSKKSAFNFTIKENPVSFLGRHTLFIYILHQPLILAVLKLIELLRR